MSLPFLRPTANAGAGRGQHEPRLAPHGSRNGPGASHATPRPDPAASAFGDVLGQAMEEGFGAAPDATGDASSDERGRRVTAGERRRPPRNGSAQGSAAAPTAADVPALASVATVTVPATAALAARHTETKGKEPAGGRRDPRVGQEPAPTREAGATRAAAPILAGPAETKVPAPVAAATTSDPVQAPLPTPPAGLEVAGGLLRSAAHLKVDAGPLGAVDLHLRLRDGTLHLRVDGDAAHLVVGRSAELSRVLARDGLELGSIELPHPDTASLQQGDAGAGGDRSQGETRRQGWEEAADARDGAANGSRAAPRGARATAAHQGNIDVQA